MIEDEHTELCTPLWTRTFFRFRLRKRSIAWSHAHDTNMLRRLGWLLIIVTKHLQSFVSPVLFNSQSSAIGECFLSCGFKVLGRSRLILLCKALHTPFITTEIRRPATLLQTVLYRYLESIIKMTFTKSKAKQKVAIVGSGMAGLITAHLLHHDVRQRYSVIIFESVRMSQILPFAGLTTFH